MKSSIQHRITLLYALIAVCVLLSSCISVPVAQAATTPTGTLSLYKAIENLATGSSEGDRTKWNVVAKNVDTGTTYVENGLNGFQTKVIPSGTYIISEQDTSRTPAGYRFRDWNCGGQVYTNQTPTITLTQGANLTCTVTNEAVQSTLTLQKKVVGGTAPTSMWTLKATDGPSQFSGTANTEAVTNRPVRLGTYRLVEEGPGAAQGYIASTWSCSWTDHNGVTGTLPVDNSGRITIELDRAVTCSITNTASLPQLTLIKQVVSPNGTAADPTSWTLSANSAGGTGLSGVSGSESVSHVTVSANTAYALAETGPTSGYSASQWNCVPNSGNILNFSGSSLTLDSNADVTCTITNTFTGGWLTLVKQVANSTQSPSDWDLSAVGSSGTAVGTTIQGATGSPNVTAVPVPAGAYTLQESGPDGYTTDGYVCNGATAGYSATVNPGETVECIITNTAKPTITQLTLTKNVTDIPGSGKLNPQDWNLTASTGGAPVFSGVTGTTAVTNVDVVPGHYVLTESDNSALGTPQEFAQYAQVGWICSDADGNSVPVSGAASNEIDIAQGLQIQCTVTNNFVYASISLRVYINGAFLENSPGEWKLEVTPAGETTPELTGDGSGDDVTGIDNQTLQPGNYTISVDPTSVPQGYRLARSGISCQNDTDGDNFDWDVTLAPSTNIFCSISYESISPTVTLVKNLDNSGGGTAQISDFVLKARGPGNAAISAVSGDSSITGVILPPGEYVFKEDGPSGYAVRWDCSGADAWDSSSEVATLGLGNNMVCTAYNTVIQPKLTLVKQVSGGTATADDWKVNATGQAEVSQYSISGITGSADVTDVTVNAGTYKLSETVVAQASSRAASYEQQGWSCTGGTLEGELITLSPGDNVICTVVNKYVPDSQSGGGNPENPDNPDSPNHPVDPNNPSQPPSTPQNGDPSASDENNIAVSGSNIMWFIIGGIVLIALGSGFVLLKKLNTREQQADENRKNGKHAHRR